MIFDFIIIIENERQQRDKLHDSNVNLPKQAAEEITYVTLNFHGEDGKDKGYSSDPVTKVMWQPGKDSYESRDDFLKYRGMKKEDFEWTVEKVHQLKMKLAQLYYPGVRKSDSLIVKLVS